RAGRDSAGNALDLRQKARDLESLLARYGDDLVDVARLQDRRDKARSDALDLVRPARLAREHRARGRLTCDYLEARLTRFQRTAAPRKRATRADADHEHVNLALGVVPDFLRRGLLVHEGVGGIVELPWDDSIRGHLC